MSKSTLKKFLTIGLAGMTMFEICADNELRFRNDPMPFANALQEYYVDIFRQRSELRKNTLAKITTRQTAEDYVKNIRREIRKRFVFPAERTPLQAKTVSKRLEKDYVIESIYFFSRPGVAVSGLFMYPDKGTQHPTVLFLCGHSKTGKFSYYQPIASDLARLGYAVLLIDPMGQGERKETELSPTHEHNSFGRRLGLSGEQFAAWRAYDAIRAIDYLESRPEADTRILGVTGCSGGCTMGSMVMALDDRPTMAALSCGITSFLHNVENELPCDIEQLPQNLGSLNMEMADFLVAAAPRPILLMMQENDFFDPRGTHEAFADLQKFYSLLGKSADAELFSDNLWHNYSVAHRSKMMQFFGRYANAGNFAPEKCDTEILPAGELCSFPQGKVSNLPGTRSQNELLVEYCRNIAAVRRSLPPDVLRKTLHDFLKTGKLDIPHYRVLRQDFKDLNGKRYIGRFGIETEPGRVMAVLKQVGRPDKGCFRMVENSPVRLYIGDLDSTGELLKAPGLADGKHTLCALDIRGIGELTPGSCDRPAERDFFNYYQFDYHFASLADFLGEPLLGKRVRDVLMTVRLLQSRNCTVELYGKNQGAIIALFAAFLGKLPVTLENIPGSYLEYVQSSGDSLPLALLPYGILKITDLDELIKYSNAEVLK